MSLIEAHWRVLEYQIAIYFASAEWLLSCLSSRHNLWLVMADCGSEMVMWMDSLWLTAYAGKCRDMITFSLPGELSSWCQDRQCCKSKAKAVAKQKQKHKQEMQLWLTAVSWEMKLNGRKANISKHRIIFQIQTVTVRCAGALST